MNAKKHQKVSSARFVTNVASLTNRARMTDEPSTTRKVNIKHGENGQKAA